MLLHSVAAPEGRSRVGFSLCEAAERRRREEQGVEAPQALRRAPKARGSRRHRRPGGRVWAVSYTHLTLPTIYSV